MILNTRLAVARSSWTQGQHLLVQRLALGPLQIRASTRRLALRRLTLRSTRNVAASGVPTLDGGSRAETALPQSRRDRERLLTEPGMAILDSSDQGYPPSLSSLVSSAEEFVGNEISW
jgi:hypothetical protein